MAPCIFQGNTDMYGLGIRLGFYLQWFGSILASFLVPRAHRDHRKDDPLKDEIIGLRFTNNVFAAATFLALFILIVGNVLSLQPVEVYIILLLTFGYSLLLIPIYIWRLLTRADPRRDPTRWPIVRPSQVESILRFLLIAAVASFQIWFWFVRVPALNGLGCQQYGFLFAKVPLNTIAMQVINILLYFGVLISCAFILLKTMYDSLSGRSERKYRGPRVRSSRKRLLQDLNIIMSLAVAIVIVLAVELTIYWNRVRGVNTLASAGQTIPFAIGAAAAVRILYVYLFKDPNPTEPASDPARPYVRPESPIGPNIMPVAPAGRPPPEGPMGLHPFPMAHPRGPEAPMPTNRIPLRSKRKTERPAGTNVLPAWYGGGHSRRR